MIDEKALEAVARAIYESTPPEDETGVFTEAAPEWQHLARVNAVAAITAYLAARAEAGFVEVNVNGVDLAEMRERARKEHVPTILLLSQAKVYEDRAALLAMLAKAK